MKPKVSVLLPVYNAESYIGEAIESILNQSFKDFEFVIINDGSSDKSEEIILSYKDERISYHKNPHNLKLVATLNKGLELVRGEYIARMDSDDISLPERFIKQVKFLDQNPEVGVCGSNVELFGEWNFITDVSNTSNDVDAELLLKNPIFHPTVMFRKSLIDKTGIRFNPAFEHLEDYYFWAELSKFTRLVNLEDILLRYRWHKENISATKQEVQYEKAAEVILFKLRTVLSLTQYTEVQLGKISKLLYVPDGRIKKLSKKELLFALRTFRDIYKYFKIKNISQKVLKKFSERVEKVIYDNPYISMYSFLFIISPVLIIRPKRRIKLLLSMTCKVVD
jgi:glycosyltransferase involved in cell wall biosynthesis